MVVGNETITRADLLKYSDLIAERAVINRFGSWRTAEAAGLQLSPKVGRWADDDYLDNLLDPHPAG
ncbi:MAG: hypothetical protein M3017_15185 [Actinomycetota bacterium]|nr:hypothetical protein [Actinomycetota bacterium]